MRKSKKRGLPSVGRGNAGLETQGECNEGRDISLPKRSEIIGSWLRLLRISENASHEFECDNILKLNLSEKQWPCFTTV
jgi:hypothetical protein